MKTAMSEMENALDRICGGSHVAEVNKDLKLEGINTETIQSETHGWSRWEKWNRGIIASSLFRLYSESSKAEGRRKPLKEIIA